MKTNICTIPIALALVAALSLGCGLTNSGGSGVCDGKDDTGEYWVNDGGPRGFDIFDGEMIFVANEGKKGGPKLMLHDGRGRPKPVDSIADETIWPFGGFVYAGAYYFTARSKEDLIPNVWRWDGDEHESIGEPWPPRQGFSPARRLTLFQDTLYFVAWNSSIGDELYRLELTGEVSLTEDLPDPPRISPHLRKGSNPRDFTSFGDVLLFNATGDKLYEFDGVTFRVLNESLSFGDSRRVEFGGKLYFAGSNDEDAVAEYGLYTYGDGGLDEVISDFHVRNMIVHKSQLHLVSTAASVDTLWRWDGEGKMEELLASEPGASITIINEFDGDLLFAMNDRIFRFDGVSTPVDVAPWTGSTTTPAAFEFEGSLYYAGKDEKGWELWEFDGTTAERIADLYPGVSCERVD